MFASEETTNSAPVLEGSSITRCPHCGAAAIAAPALQNASSGDMLALRCFVRRSYTHGGYIAECLDLDISAQAQSLEQAIAGLQDAVLGYLDVIFESQTAKATDVLRPAPLGHWILYFLEQTKYLVAASISQYFQRKKEIRFYKVSPYTHCQV